MKRSRPSGRRSYRRPSKRTRRAPLKKKRFGRRKGNVTNVKRTCYLGVMQPGTATTNGFWQYRTVSLNTGFTDGSAASMGGLSNVAEYQAVFDQYKLNAYKITLRPRYVDQTTNAIGPAGSGLVAGFNRNFVTIVKDPTDQVTPSGTFTAATFNTFMETGKPRTMRGDKTISIYMRPKVIEQYGSGANRYVSPKWTDLNTAGLAVPYRGYHLFFHTLGFDSASLSGYDVFITYYLQFKGQK